MSDLEPTTAQERMDYLAEVSDAIVEGLPSNAWRWAPDVADATSDAVVGKEFHLRWHHDDTVLLLIESAPVMRLRVEVTVSAVEFEDRRNEPIGPEQAVTWSTLPGGWFVQTPRGEWLEVGSTNLNTHTGQQMVALRVKGDFVVFPRDPAGSVIARCGSLHLARDAALDALHGAGFTTAILSDDPSQAS